MADAQTLRIVHCFRSPIGGIFRHVRDLAELHSAAGHEVGILCDSSTGGAHEDRLFDQIMPFLKLGVTRFPIGRSVGLKDMAALAESYKLIKELQPDILHGHGAKGGVIARLIGSLLRVRRYRVARLYSPHGGSLHFSRRSLSGQGVFMAERILERLTESISFVCDYERTTYETKIGKPHCAATRIYNGISERDFGRIPVTEDGADFAYIGMLRDLKGPDVFINAFAEAERLVGRPLSGLIIGDGPDLERYQRMVEQKGFGPPDRFSPGHADRAGLCALRHRRRAIACRSHALHRARSTGCREDSHRIAGRRHSRNPGQRQRCACRSRTGRSLRRGHGEGADRSILVKALHADGGCLPIAFFGRRDGKGGGSALPGPTRTDLRRNVPD